MEFYAARLNAAQARHRSTAPGPAWGPVVPRGLFGWAPPSPGGGDRRGGLPPRPPRHGAAAAAGWRGQAFADGRGGVPGQREAVVARDGSGGSAADWRGKAAAEAPGVDGRGKAEQEARRVDGRGKAEQDAVVRAGVEAAGMGLAFGARGVPGSAAAREEAGKVGTKRPPAALPAHHPPPKRTAVSARRQFPPGCGRDAAAPLGRADGSSRSRAARADASSKALADAAPVPRTPLQGSNDGVPPLSGAGDSRGSASSSGLNKVSAADDDGDTGPVANVAHLLPGSQLLAKRRIVSANRSFPPGCGRDAAVPLLSGRADAHGLGVTEEMLAGGDCSAADNVSLDAMATPRDGAIDGAAVQHEELEEGEIPPEGVQPLVQEHLGSQVSAIVTLYQPAHCGQGTSVQAIGALEASVTPSSDQKVTSGSRIHCGENWLPSEVSKDLINSSAWSSFHVSAESLSGGPSQEQPRGSRVSEVAKIDNTCCQKINGSIIQGGEKGLSSGVAKDFINSSASSSCHVASESLSEGPPQEHLRGNRVSEIPKMDKASFDFAVEIPKMDNPPSDFAVEIPKIVAVQFPKMDKASSDFAAAGFSEDAPMRRKAMFTPRKTVRPPKVIKKSAVDTRHSPFCDSKGKENELGRNNATKNETEDTDEFTKGLVQLALTSSEQRPVTQGKGVVFSKKTQGKEAAAVTGYFGPKKRVKVKHPANLPMKFNPKCELGSKEKLDDKADSSLDDDVLLKEVAFREGKLEFYFKDSSHVRSRMCQRQYGVQNAEASSKVKMMCRRFEIICRTIAQGVDQRSVKVRRIDLAADKAMKKLPDYSKPGPIVGNVPGVQVGDGFLYRVQLAIAGLHRPYQGGIDWIKDNDHNLIAISVVASGGYPDELSSSGELVYTGSGGKLAGKNASGDQKLERGNIALKNCIKRKSPVRVIHGFKGQNKEEGSHSRAKEITTFTYDGLYYVVDCWMEGQPGSKVCKFRLQRIPGQPELPHGRIMS